MIPDKYAFMQQPLNFPEFKFNIQENEGKLSIFDPLRKKYLVLTPEEWIRQHMVNFLVEFKDYPKNLFAQEKGIQYNSLQKRFDILIHNRQGDPFLLIECKAPDVKISQKTVEQVAIYNKIIKAPFMGVSNGIHHLFFTYINSEQKYEQLSDLPQFQS